VLSKLFVATVVVPVGVLLLALLTQPLLGIVVWMRKAELGDYLTFATMSGWPEGLGRLLAYWFYSVLWYLPLAGYLMLASVLARRAPLVYAIVPPAVILIWEAWMLESHPIRNFLVERFVTVGRAGGAILGPASGLERWPEHFLSVDLWAGVAVGAGMLYIVIRLRRYRDDT
jgi:ABC-2 type transport system permease protein